MDAAHEAEAELEAFRQLWREEVTTQSLQKMRVVASSTSTENSDSSSTPNPLPSNRVSPNIRGATPEEIPIFSRYLFPQFDHSNFIGPAPENALAENAAWKALWPTPAEAESRRTRAVMPSTQYSGPVEQHTITHEDHDAEATDTTGGSGPSVQFVSKACFDDLPLELREEIYGHSLRTTKDDFNVKSAAALRQSLSRVDKKYSSEFSEVYRRAAKKWLLSAEGSLLLRPGVRVSWGMTSLDGMDTKQLMVRITGPAQDPWESNVGFVWRSTITWPVAGWPQSPRVQNSSWHCDSALFREFRGALQQLLDVANGVEPIDVLPSTPPRTAGSASRSAPPSIFGGNNAHRAGTQSLYRTNNMLSALYRARRSAYRGPEQLREVFTGVSPNEKRGTADKISTFLRETGRDISTELPAFTALNLTEELLKTRYICPGRWAPPHRALREEALVHNQDALWVWSYAELNLQDPLKIGRFARPGCIVEIW